MIHVRPQAADLNDDPVLHVSFVGLPEIQRFRTVLGRALNCAADFDPAWFELSDRLDQFLANHDVPISR